MCCCYCKAYRHLTFFWTHCILLQDAGKIWLQFLTEMRWFCNETFCSYSYEFCVDDYEILLSCLTIATTDALTMIVDVSVLINNDIILRVSLMRNVLWWNYSRSLYAIGRLSSVCLSVTFLHPTQTIETFRSLSVPFNTLAIWWHPGKILRRSSQRNLSIGRIKHKRGSQI